MNPGEYFSNHYINDLRLFADGSDTPSHGPFGLLCGLTIEPLAKLPVTKYPTRKLAYFEAIF